MMAKERNRSYLKHTTSPNRLEAKLEHAMADDDTADRRSSETLKQTDSLWLRPSRKRDVHVFCREKKASPFSLFVQ